MNRRWFNTIGLAAASQFWRSCQTRGEEVPDDDPSTGNLNAPARTLGGRQFWADELFFHDWHIQRNSFTGHCRLLDGNNRRHGWGTFEQCRAKLDEIKRERRLPPMHNTGVIVLHGLFRSGASMSYMARYLRDEGGYTVFNVNYPTTRGDVAEHASVLGKIIDNLAGIDTIYFVAHSLGNLVIRHYLHDHTRPDSGIVPDRRIKRIVMLGPPNHGAQMAEAFSGMALFHKVVGASGSQLSRQWDELEAKLATPTCEFGILAGGRGDNKGYNPLLDGDNDMVVSVETTQLAGATDFAVLPVLHTLMMDDAKVQQYTLRFLRYGYFVSADQRHPLVANAPRQNR